MYTFTFEFLDHSKFTESALEIYFIILLFPLQFFTIQLKIENCGDKTTREFKNEALRFSQSTGKCTDILYFCC